jgi:hypothetical protein
LGSYILEYRPLFHAEINGNKLFDNLLQIDRTRYQETCITIVVQTLSILNWFLHQKHNCIEMTIIFRKYMRQNAGDEFAVRHCFSV